MVVATPNLVVERFVARLTRLGVKVHRSGSGAQAVATAVLDVVRAIGAGSAMVADDLGDEREAVVAALTGGGIGLNAGASGEEADPVDVGITRAAFGVAETGSLGVAGNDVQPRIATMLPPYHVALVDVPKVLPSLDEAGAEIERLMTGQVRYVSLVTGPSRTADVEKTLAVGVHGPKELHAILVGAD